MANKKITEADLRLLLQLREDSKKKGNSNSDYIFEGLHRQGFDIPDSLFSYYKEPTESLSSFLKSGNISPKSPMEVLVKSKWEHGDKPFVKEYDKLPREFRKKGGGYTTGTSGAAPDTVHIKRGDIDAFIKHSPYKGNIDWDKHYWDAKKEARKNKSSQGLLNKAKESYGW